MAGVNEHEREELMDRVLDGMATAEERAEVERLQASDPEARRRMEQRALLFETLRSVPRVEPPVGFRAGIASMIAREPARARTIGESLRAWFTFGPVQRRAIAFAGFAVGSLVTIATVALVSRGPGGVLPIAGTMTRPDGRIGSRVGFDRIEVGGGRFDAETFVSGRKVRLVVRGRADVATDLTVAFDEEELQFRSFEPLEGDTQVQMGAGRAHISGRGHTVIALGWESRVSNPGPIRVTARAGGEGRDVRLPTVAGVHDGR